MEEKEAHKGTRKPWTLREIGGKPVWDWLALLLVPLLLGIIAASLTAWFNAQQDARQNDIEDRRAQAERELAEQRAQDEALQAYLDQMGSLLLEKKLRTSEKDSEVRTLARARTLTVLGRLDPVRKTEVMQFLVEAKLIQSVKGREPIIRLVGADLRGTSVPGEGTFRGAALGILTLTDLSGAHLSAANLSDSNLSSADLRDADLFGADLSNADLRDANLSGADLSGADLSKADLIRANLSNAYVNAADLRNADLSGADLSGAILQGSDLSKADLIRANLSNAKLSNAYLGGAEGIKNEELEQQAKSLAGATMPNGQKYEDWLKSNGSEEGGENSGSS